jgi:hypothetical protein
MFTIKNLPAFCLLFITAVVLFSAASPLAGGKVPPGGDILLETYQRIGTKLQNNSFGLPLYLESADQDNRVHVDVYGIINHPYSRVLSVLQSPANWCDIVSLHPNIKGCTYRELPGAWLLTFYSGRKFYQSPEEAYQIMYSCRTIEESRGYLDIALSADEGPFGTKDHRMGFEALALDAGRTFVHFRYAHSYGFSLQVAEKVYFGTLGRGKVGFTASGTDSDGNPIFVGGPRGAIERNAVRYYFALQSFMDTMREPAESRFGTRLTHWYDLTTLYRKQLFDLDKKNYLTYKTAEHKNQMELQQQISTGLHQAPAEGNW